MGAARRLCQGWQCRNVEGGAWGVGRTGVMMATALFFFVYGALGKWEK